MKLYVLICPRAGRIYGRDDLGAWKGGELGPPKWGRIRMVAMTENLERELNEYWQDVLTCRPQDLVVCWDDASPIGISTYTGWFHALMSNMGIDRKARNLSAHSFRHTRITLWKQAGMPMEALQAMVGHSEERTTAGYTHLQPDYLLEETRKAEG